MKVNINIDCTPMEARIFFGLPDIKPLQDNLLHIIEKHIQDNLKIVDINRLLHVWLPEGIQGLEKMQSVLWSQFMTNTGNVHGAIKADNSLSDKNE